MKHFTRTNRIVYFPIKCPKDAALKNALVKAIEAPDGKMMPGIAECHGSCGDTICARCLFSVTSLFFHDQEPDELWPAGVDPRTSPVWQG